MIYFVFININNEKECWISKVAMRKIHFDVMRFKDILYIDNAEILAGGLYIGCKILYFHDSEKLAEKDL
jgi:hypothetical protein